MECDNNITEGVNTDCIPKVEVTPKQFFKLLKKHIKRATKEEELQSIWNQAVKYKDAVSKAQGVLIEEMINRKLIEVRNKN